jgi:hypothetical protein
MSRLQLTFGKTRPTNQTKEYKLVFKVSPHTVWPQQRLAATYPLVTGVAGSTVFPPLSESDGRSSGNKSRQSGAAECDHGRIDLFLFVKNC